MVGFIQLVLFFLHCCSYILQYAIGDRVISDGIFLELGACDGVMYSNTKMLQDHFGFTGVLIEPVPDLFEKLVQNRKGCKCYNYAVSDKTDSFVDFVGNNACSGIVDTINDGALKYVDNKVPYKVANQSLAKLVEHSGFRHIDFMIVDVEGGELNVLRSMDWERTPVFVVIVEAHSGEHEANQKVREFLESKHFIFKERQRGNHVFVNPNYARRDLFLQSFLPG